MTIAGFGRRDLIMLKNLFFMSLADRFLGSKLGIVWAVISPLILMSVFVFVFSFVFPGRLPGRDGSLPFVIWLISGYGPWLALSEGLNTAASSVVASSGIVKNIAFKSELLPVVGGLFGLVPLSVAIAILIPLRILEGGSPGAALLFLPIAALILLLFISGAGLFLSSINVFVRDVSLALPNILLLFLFTSPIFYPITAYPEAIQAVLRFNPFYVLAECFRAPIIHGTLPPLWMIAYIVALSSALCLAGLWWFRRLKAFFDVRL
ncbi:MAG: ABC transporter permease [Geminicoccaceae bacterium]|jgi:lipopolysaccharide transport system permease protein